MSKEISDECSVVAFYGLRLSPSRLRSIYDYLTLWFDSLNAHPNKLGVHGEGFTGKAGSYRTNDARLRRSGFDAVDGFSLYALKSGGDVPLWDWLVSAEISREESYCIIGCSSTVAQLTRESSLYISRLVMNSLTPCYGIGFRREMRLGPTLYAGGLAQGLQPWGDELAEVTRINDWGRIGIKNRVYEQGLFRDIYPWNFLTDVHLAKQVEAISLKRWIEEGPGRGVLSNVTDSMLLWEVPDANIPQVRAALQAAGLIFCATGLTEYGE